MHHGEAQTSDPRLGEVEQWLLDRSRTLGTERTTIDADLDLVASGLIDSLRLVEFAFLVGKLTGTRLDPSELKLDQFRTLRQVSELFGSSAVS